MARPAPTPTTPPEVDPLADLRQDDDAPPPVVTEGPEGPALEAVEIRPMVSQELWSEMVSEMVAAWHQDPTSQGFLHGGGSCGCWYIARQALTAAVPVALESDLEEQELEPASE